MLNDRRCSDLRYLLDEERNSYRKLPGVKLLPQWGSNQQQLHTAKPRGRYQDMTVPFETLEAAAENEQVHKHRPLLFTVAPAYGRERDTVMQGTGVHVGAALETSYTRSSCFQRNHVPP